MNQEVLILKMQCALTCKYLEYMQRMDNLIYSNYSHSANQICKLLNNLMPTGRYIVRLTWNQSEIMCIVKYTENPHISKTMSLVNLLKMIYLKNNETSELIDLL